MVPSYPPCYLGTWGACTLFASGIRVRSGRTHTKVGTFPSPPSSHQIPPPTIQDGCLCPHFTEVETEACREQ